MGVDPVSTLSEHAIFMTMPAFQYLDHLPSIPEDIVPDVTAIDWSADSLSDSRQRSMIRDGGCFPAGKNRRDDLKPELELWLRQNIIDQWQNIGISVTSSPCHGPHIDRSRFYVLQYLLEAGGTDVSTVFYEPKGQRLDMEPGYFWFNNYDQLQETHRTTFPIHRWILMDVRNYIHSVENIQTARISLQIGLMREPVFTAQA